MMVAYCGNRSGVDCVFPKATIHGFMRLLSVRILGTAVLFLGACAAHAVVLDPPALRCASVAPNGDVTLTWIVPPDPNGDFAEYEVFQSNVLGGPYVSLGSIPVYAQNTKTNANAQPHGPEGFAGLRALTQKPVMAIGGLKPGNSASVVAAGADGQIPMEAMEQSLRRYSALRRAAQQQAKASRRVHTSASETPADAAD